MEDSFLNPNTILLPDGVDPPELGPVPPAARVGRLSRGGADHQGVHEGGHHHRPQVVGGVRARLLPLLRPHQALQVQANAAD